MLKELKDLGARRAWTWISVVAASDEGRGKVLVQREVQYSTTGLVISGWTCRFEYLWVHGYPLVGM